MDKVSLTFLVFFEDPFWIGIVERISDGTMEVCRITFGAEPKDYVSSGRRKVKENG